MLKMNQKIKWTKTELKKFAEYDALESEGMCLAEDAMLCGGAITVKSSIDKQLDEIRKMSDRVLDELKSLMGTTRFNIIMNSRPTLKAWRGEVCARYLAKHPEEAPQDCRPGWE